MRRKLTRRRIFVIVVGYLFLAFIFHRFRDEQNEPLASSTTHASRSPEIDTKACRIWPNSDASERENLRYNRYDGELALLPSIGDAGVIGDSTTCLKPESRFDAYRTSPTKSHYWDAVQWGSIQKRCASANQHLYRDEIRTDTVRNYHLWRQPPSPAHTDLQPQDGGRTAVVLRTWDNFEYTESQRIWLRALIAETALHSAGHYEVFLLVNVKDHTIQLEEDEEAYQWALERSVPKEFQDMAVLWNQRTVEKWYPKIPEHGAQDQMYQALQIFSHQFPFDYYWQLEMDLRLTSHVYDTLENAAEFARHQGRRNLWERNGRFFDPSQYRGSFKLFSDAVDAEIGDSGIWGPVATTNFKPKGPRPPPRSEKGWGIGEDPELISLFPMIDPIGTDWVYEKGIHGFADGLETPRRAAFMSMTRSSRRLLQLVSEAQQQRGQWLVSEATLETFALLHGLKAVTVPHFITFAVQWTTRQVMGNIQRGPPSNKAGGNWMSSAYTTHGWIPGPWWQSSYWCKGNDADNLWRDYVTGTCMPPMILHPVKKA